MWKFIDLTPRARKIFYSFVVVAMFAGIAFYYLGTSKVMPQSLVFLLDEVKVPERGQRIIFFSPHPDDETIGAGGYIIKARQNGAEVRIVLVTDGNKHGLKDKRYNEFRSATSELGVSNDDLVFLNYPDGKLDKVEESELNANFEAQISQFNPNFVVYPNPTDRHSDHATVGRVIKDILGGNKGIISYQYLVHYPDFPQPKIYSKRKYLLPPIDAVRFDDQWFRLMFDTNIENQKDTAIHDYGSQLRVPFLRSLILSSVRKNELFSRGF